MVADYPNMLNLLILWIIDQPSPFPGLTSRGSQLTMLAHHERCPCNGDQRRPTS
jgi:hypothetical protein